MNNALNPYWAKLVADAQELIAACEKRGAAAVGLYQAKAIVAVDEEVIELRAFIERALSPVALAVESEDKENGTDLSTVPFSYSD